ncbi:MerR family transcriptional regulator [Paenibacillus polymyxa]|uniref:MerR family transcriptional regulator n=1 Tax=Paenibacillus polymyxa TaxID=1406 RepID=UPI0025B6F34A|nr:MerR family transcriptional regulator [Paenibacillus polymyxa]MDN4081319.1 MerR family transcriptional regulator [Paenibacillus polymyxa]MDN4116962.1 MerR family transcriptional regulator [Paenibacillus polymyxa]
MKTADVASFLGVKPVTVRKYATALEKAGYIVERSDSNNRSYTEKDAMMMKELATLCKDSGISIEKGATLVAAKNIRLSGATEVVAATAENRYDERYDQALELLRQMSEYSKQQAGDIASLRAQMEQQSSGIAALQQELEETKKLLDSSLQRKWWNFFRRNTDKLDQGERDPEMVWKKKKQREQDIYTPGRG